MTVPQPRRSACKHVFVKVDGVWTCECGERRDKHGKPLKERHLHVAGK